MNKPVFYIFMGLWLCSTFKNSIQAQENLVSNGSFEDTTITTPDFGFGYREICKDWHNASYGTVDYFSAHCAVLATPNLAGCVPENFYGFQEAKEGVAYAGVILYERLTNEINPECLQGQLTYPLVENKFYKFKFFLNVVDSSNYKTCNLDVFFENQNIYCLNCLPPITKYASFDISALDSSAWFEFTFVFQALGGEQYFYFSNYDSASEVLICEVDQYVDQAYNSAYYIFDDVSLVEVIESNLLDIEIPNVFSPNDDGTNDFFVIPSDENGSMLTNISFLIFNRWGQLIFEGDENMSWGGKFSDGPSCPEGVYYYRAHQKFYGQEFTKTGFIHLIR